MNQITPNPENLAPLVHLIRGEKVLLDSDLAALYGVTAKILNQAVSRNRSRFPEDFMFRLSGKEVAHLRSQIVTSRLEAAETEQLTSEKDAPIDPLRSQSVTLKSHGGTRYLPYAFTEQGVAMLSSVLRSPRAVEVNIAIMRTFVQLRRLMDSNRDLARQIESLEKKYDEQFAVVFDAIKQLIAADRDAKAKPKRRIGFTP